MRSVLALYASTCANFQARTVLVVIHGMEPTYVALSANTEDRVDELVLCTVSYYFDKEERRVLQGHTNDGAVTGGPSGCTLTTGTRRRSDGDGTW